MKKKVLFICINNSARSQIAEGLFRTLYGNHFEVFSAGTKPTSVNPYAIKVMDEIGIDISKQYSKNINEFLNTEFDYVITICNQDETCPFFPNVKQYIHKPFEDPAKYTDTDKEKMLFVFRRVRDEIKNWIEQNFEEQKNKNRSE